MAKLKKEKNNNLIKKQSSEYEPKIYLNNF